MLCQVSYELIPIVDIVTFWKSSSPVHMKRDFEFDLELKYTKVKCWLLHLALYLNEIISHNKRYSLHTRSVLEYILNGQQIQEITTVPLASRTISMELHLVQRTFSLFSTIVNYNDENAISLMSWTPIDFDFGVIAPNHRS